MEVAAAVLGEVKYAGLAKAKHIVDAPPFADRKEMNIISAPSTGTSRFGYSCADGLDTLM
jgi:hypothetical protein